LSSGESLTTNQKKKRPLILNRPRRKIGTKKIWWYFFCSLVATLKCRRR
jgi:hypothetical protein